MAIVTTFLTVTSGVSVFVIGQVAIRFFLDPVSQLRKLIGEIAYSLDYYANVDFRDLEASKEARQKYRHQACHMRELLYQIPCYIFFEKVHILPMRRHVEQASRHMIGLSNNDGTGEKPDMTIMRLLCIQEL